MENKNVFDVVMDFIDDNIDLSPKEMNKGIYAQTGYSDVDINKFISILSKGKMSLKSYVAQRKAYFAARELVYQTDKPIVEIATKYYSEQSSLNRAMKKYYNLTPARIRKQNFIASDNRIHYSDFLGRNKSRLDSILEEFIRTHDIVYTNDWHYFEEFINATEEYGFDEATCCAVSTIAERCGIPFGYMLNACFDIVADYRSNPEYVDPEIETSMDLGINSEKEMKEICDFFNCEYYQLDQFMITHYRNRKKQE